MNTRVLLYSGGMDSVALDVLWHPDVRVYVDLGTRYGDLERERLPAGVEVVDLPLRRWEREDKIIPLRNLMLCAVGAQYGDTIALAATAGDRVLDKSREFAQLTSELFTYLWQPQHWTAGEERTVVLPIKGLTKAEVVREVQVAAGVEGVVRVARSFSCYTPEAGRECGNCKPCARKWIAFAANNLGHLVTNARPYVVREYLPLVARGSFGRRGEVHDLLAAFGWPDTENEMQTAEMLIEREGA